MFNSGQDLLKKIGEVDAKLSLIEGRLSVVEKASDTGVFAPGAFTTLADIRQGLCEAFTKISDIHKAFNDHADATAKTIHLMSNDLEQLVKAAGCRKRLVEEIPAVHTSAIPAHTIIEKIQRKGE